MRKMWKDFRVIYAESFPPRCPEELFGTASFGGGPCECGMVYELTPPATPGGSGRRRQFTPSPVSQRRRVARRRPHRGSGGSALRYDRAWRPGGGVRRERRVRMWHRIPVDATGDAGWGLDGERAAQLLE